MPLYTLNQEAKIEMGKTETRRGKMGGRKSGKENGVWRGEKIEKRKTPKEK